MEHLFSQKIVGVVTWIGGEPTDRLWRNSGRKANGRGNHRVSSLDPRDYSLYSSLCCFNLPHVAKPHACVCKFGHRDEGFGCWIKLQCSTVCCPLTETNPCRFAKAEPSYVRVSLGVCLVETNIRKRQLTGAEDLIRYTSIRYSVRHLGMYM